MDRPKMGRAVIINNIHSESPESTVDVEALVETYEKVGFEVEVHNDCDVKASSTFMYTGFKKNVYRTQM